MTASRRPDGAGLHGLLQSALQAHQAGRLDEADAVYRDLLVRHPDHPDALHLRGLVAHQRGDGATAVALIGGAIRVSPTVARYHNNLGRALALLGRLAEAEASYRHALDLEPGYAEAAKNLGGLYAERGQYEAAADCFLAAAQARPDDADAHNRLGRMPEHLNRFDAAVDAFGRAIDCRPEFMVAHANLGNLQKLLGRPGESAACFQRAIVLEPDIAELRVNLGTALKAAGRLDEAADAYRAALALDPGLAEAHRGLGITLADLGRDDEAEAALLRAIEHDPDAAAPHHNLAELLLRRGDAAAALAACDDCLAVDPGNSQALAVKAAALDERGARAAVRALVDLDQLVATTRFDAADGFSDMAAFNAALADHVCNHPTRSFEPPNKATRRGTQTRELLVEPKGPVAALERMIIGAVEDYLGILPAMAAHPFAAATPSDWWLTAWATILDSGGHQAPHIHPAAWLSGVYYVQVPSAVTADDPGHAGWIEFGRPDPGYNATVEPDVRLIRPEPGRIVLFPSYFYHRTLPFEASDYRISIAFDVMREDMSKSPAKLVRLAPDAGGGR